MREFRMPKIALGADDEVRVVAWVVHEGGEVASGEPLLEVETDKANQEVEATSDGILAKQLAAVGDAVRPGAVIGLIADAGEQYDPAVLRISSGDSGPQVGTSGLDPAVAMSSVGPVAPEEWPRSERGPGSGPRLSLRYGYLAGLPPARNAGNVPGAAARLPPDPELVGGSHRIVEPAKHRSAVARAMSASAVIPQFPVFNDIDVTAACRALDRIRSSTPEASLTDLMIAAVAATLRCHQLFNSWYDGNSRIEFADINLSIAVDGPDGVVAPVIRGVDSLPLEELVNARQELVDRARSRRLAPADLVGGTFTVSNLGSLGVGAVAPMVVPPQVAVLGVGRMRAGPDASTITMTLVSDHRVVDGADAARFLAGLSQALNDPEISR